MSRVFNLSFGGLVLCALLASCGGGGASSDVKPVTEILVVKAADCPEAAQAWAVGGITCSALAAAQPSNSLAQLVNAVPGSSGAATYSCNNGIRTQVANPAAACVYLPINPIPGPPVQPPPAPPVQPATNALKNDGDKFIVTYSQFTAGPVTEYRLYSMRNPNDPPRAMVDRTETGLQMTDPYVYDGVRVYYRVVAVVNGEEKEVYSTDGVQPDRIWAKEPLVITESNKTYSGNYRSSNPAVPAIRIQSGVTGVVITNSRIASAGDGIDAQAGSIGVEVRNSRAWGLHPKKANSVHGKFFAAFVPKSVVIENNYMETWHFNVLVNGDKSLLPTLKVRFNRMRNAQGRITNADGTYQPKRSLSSGVAHPIQVDKVQGSAGTEIAWNELIQEPSIGFTEDIINYYTSSGTPALRAKIHNNVVFGGYATEPGKAPPISQPPGFRTGLNNAQIPLRQNVEGYGVYSGCGIITDGPSYNDSDVGHVDVFSNIVIGTSNCGISIASGNNVAVYDNRLISSGLLEDGTRIWQNNVALTIWSQYVDFNTYGNALFVRNSRLTNNYVGWQLGAYERSDADTSNYFYYNNWLFNGGDLNNRGNTAATQVTENAQPTIQTERNEYQLFWKRVRSNSAITIGIR